MEILKQKLKNDLLKQCQQYKQQNEITDDGFDDWLDSRVQELVEAVDLNMYDNSINETKCMARMWKDNSSHQCTHTKKEGDYCGKHTRMLKYDGILRFGDIRSEIPRYDLIKQKEGILEELSWLNPDPLKQLQGILDLQAQKVIHTTPHLIVK